jgi:tRNA (guanine-N7-)-methyltransferase
MTFFWEIHVSYLRSCLVTPTWVDCLCRQFLSNFFTGSFGQIFLQSDVREVAVDMRDQFDANTTVFTRVHTKNSAACDQEGWLLENPLGVATEREIHALAQGGRLYRLLFRRL